MTVAAVILIPELAAALCPVEGEAALRRVAHAAWAGGAIPILAVTPRPTEELRAAVADTDVTFVEPAPSEPRGIAWFTRGLRVARQAVAGTSAALLWPVSRVWVDPETVTSLVEAHGPQPDAILRPVYSGQPGFPILIPAALLDRLAALAGKHGEDAVDALIADGVPVRRIELGDPGITHDTSTQREALPAYQGPPEPAAGPRPEWNQALAESAEPL